MTGGSHDLAHVASQLETAGRRNLTVALLAALRGADARAPVAPRSVRLCAALGELAGAVFDALTPAPDDALRDRVTEAAAALALLTKVDDQVIDGRAFHGGAASSRDALRRTTTAYLAPTLDSLRTARPRYDEARCVLAAFTGQRLAAIAHDPARLAAHHSLIARGWDTQVDAVVTLTAHPATVSAARVARVSTHISTLWLGMISAVGALPFSAPPSTSLRRRRAMLRWGRWIQRADALADLARDLDDGLVSTAVSHTLWTRAPSAFDDALRRRDTAAIYALVAEHRVDAAMLPPPGALARAARELDGLGALPAHLAWIHAYLLGRYESDPLRARITQEHPCSAP
jgi:hypothetical protein